MKSFLLALVLAPITVHGVALGKNRLPRLATVQIKDFTPLGSVTSLQTSMALLPIKTLEKSSRDKSYRKRLKSSVKMAATSAIIVTGTAVYKVFFDLSLSNIGTVEIYHVIGLGVGYGLSYGSTAMTIKELADLYRIKDAFKRITKATEDENNIVIYESEGEHRIGILTHAGEELFIVDAQGNEEAIESEQLVQVVAIRDGLPPGNFSNWLFRNKPMSSPISARFANDYLDATLAFTYKGKNHLGTVDAVRFSSDGRGELDIVTASGEELIISSGKRGQPVVIDANTGEMGFSKDDKLRGVLFFP